MEPFVGHKCVCGKEIRTVSGSSVHCACGEVSIASGRILPNRPVRTRANYWAPLHRYPIDNAGDWSSEAAREWFQSWKRNIRRYVGCGSCPEHFEVILNNSKPDYSTPDAFSKCAWGWHNAISEKIGKTTISYEDSVGIWRGYDPGSMDNCCIAITSLSPKDHSVERQAECLDSWVKHGLTVHAQNSSAEVDKLRGVYPQVSQWHVCDNESEHYQNKTQEIYSLAQTVARVGHTALLINSDVELRGSQQHLRDAAVTRNTLTGILRHNYDTAWWNSEREKWGIDAFLLTPEMASTIPAMGYAIGKPMWDYWIPTHFRSLGMDVDLIGAPFMFHKDHARQWSDEEWSMGAKWLEDAYKIKMQHWRDPVAFRQSLPFPPPSQDPKVGS